jgi:hypothetical protein
LVTLAGKERGHVEERDTVRPLGCHTVGRAIFTLGP